MGLGAAAEVAAALAMQKSGDIVHRKLHMGQKLTAGYYFCKVGFMSGFDSPCVHISK